MSKDLLSQVIIALVNEHAAAKDYGVSLVTIPDFDYAKLACSIESSRQVQFFFLGFSKEQEMDLTGSLFTEQLKSMSHNYCACALEPGSLNYEAHILQLLKLTHPRARAPQREKPLQ